MDTSLASFYKGYSLSTRHDLVTPISTRLLIFSGIACCTKTRYQPTPDFYKVTVLEILLTGRLPAPLMLQDCSRSGYEKELRNLRIDYEKRGYRRVQTAEGSACRCKNQKFFLLDIAPKAFGYKYLACNLWFSNRLFAAIRTWRWHPVLLSPVQAGKMALQRHKPSA